MCIPLLHQFGDDLCQEYCQAAGKLDPKAHERILVGDSTVELIGSPVCHAQDKYASTKAIRDNVGGGERVSKEHVQHGF